MIRVTITGLYQRRALRVATWRARLNARRRGTHDSVHIHSPDLDEFFWVQNLKRSTPFASERQGDVCEMVEATSIGGRVIFTLDAKRYL
jgi:hypothetical protein